VTLGNHGQSVCAMGVLGGMDALEIGDRCPAPSRGQFLAEPSTPAMAAARNYCSLDFLPP
jgi:hypothetical protein